MIFQTISGWMKAGGMQTGLYTFENPVKETERAIGFSCQKLNRYGDLAPSVCWFPLSRVQIVHNDFYDKGPEKMYLVPKWLYNQKNFDGFVF